MYENLGEDLRDQLEQSVRPLRAPCRKPCGANATCVITYACPCDGRLTVVVHLHGRPCLGSVVLRASLEQALVGYHTVGLATEPFSMAQNNNEQSKGNPEPACLAPSAQPKHAPHQQKACRPPRLWKNHTPPLNPLHRNSTRRLIIDTPIPQDNHRIGRAVVEDINNRLLEKTKDEKICVDAVLYSRTGRPVIIAAMTTDAEALLPHRHLIMETITGRQGKTRAYVDRPQFRVKLNGVPTKDPAGKPLTAAVVLNYISGIWARYNDMEINWKLDHQPSWITPPEELAKKSHSTIVIPFNDKETATKFYRYKDFLVFGERCRTSLYTDHPPKNRSIHKQDEHPPQTPATDTEATTMQLEPIAATNASGEPP